MREHKKPTRRKIPSRHERQYQNITIYDYSPPWTVVVDGIIIVAAFLGIVTMLGVGRMAGWW